MPKLTLEDISLSLAISGLARSSDSEDHLIAEELRARRSAQANISTDYFQTLNGKSICSNCLFRIAMNALLNMTLPDNPSVREIEEQEMILRHYVIQEAMDRHESNTDSLVTPGQLH